MWGGYRASYIIPANFSQGIICLPDTMEQFKNYIRFRRAGKNQDRVTSEMVCRLGLARAMFAKSFLLFLSSGLLC